jgi:hypothetical protein
MLAKGLDRDAAHLSAIEQMSERRASRETSHRNDRQILAHDSDVFLLAAVARGLLVRASGSPGTPWMLGNDSVRSDLRRLAREDLLLCPFAGTTPPTLLPRGVRLLAVARGELPMPLDE